MWKKISESAENCPNCGCLRPTPQSYRRDRYRLIDTGIGISEELQEQILKGNASTTLGTNNEKGSGLGLKITKEFIEMTGGQVTLESKIGEGTTFSIILPNVK